MLLLLAEADPFSIFSGVAGIIGAVFAGVFFIYKLASGWLMLNMSISVKAERQKHGTDKDQDHLRILVRFEKGDRDSMYPTDIQARITPLASDGCPNYDKSKISHILGYDAVQESFDGDIFWGSSPKHLQVRAGGCFPCPSCSSGRTNFKPIRFGPGETFEFGAYRQVDSETVYLVEIAYLAHNWLYRIYMQSCAQWRTSTISLPIKSNPSDKS